MMIEAESTGRAGPSMLQNAETIRLCGRTARPVSVTEAKEGDEVLVHIDARAKGETLRRRGRRVHS